MNFTMQELYEMQAALWMRRSHLQAMSASDKIRDMLLTTRKAEMKVAEEIVNRISTLG